MSFYNNHVNFKVDNKIIIYSYMGWYKYIQKTYLYDIISCGWENSGGCHAIVTHVALCADIVNECGGDGAANTLPV